MKLLSIFRQKDVFPSQEDHNNGIVFEDRLTGKVILFDNENNIALMGTGANSLYLLPGGGIDKGESIENGIIRECLEETGCEAALVDEIGIVEDYRNRDKKHCISYCYTAKLIGDKGEPSLTEEEKKNNLHVVWFPAEEALKILEKEAEQLRIGEVGFYNTGFNILRDHLFLKQLKLLGKSN